MQDYTMNFLSFRVDKVRKDLILIDTGCTYRILQSLHAFSLIAQFLTSLPNTNFHLGLTYFIFFCIYNSFCLYSRSPPLLPVLTILPSFNYLYLKNWQYNLNMIISMLFWYFSKGNQIKHLQKYFNHFCQDFNCKLPRVALQTEMGSINK